MVTLKEFALTGAAEVCEDPSVSRPGSQAEGSERSRQEEDRVL